MLMDGEKYNPMIYSWHKVVIKYCDGERSGQETYDRAVTISTLREGGWGWFDV
jgi:hypothetical protein